MIRLKNEGFRFHGLDAAEGTGDEIGLAPDGVAHAVWRFLIVDGSDQRLPGKTVTLQVRAMRPLAPWREKDDLVAKFTEFGGASAGAKAKAKIEGGTLRQLSTCPASVVSGPDGVVEVPITASHIGSDFAQQRKGAEQVVATCESATLTQDLAIGYTNLGRINAVQGLAVASSATGRYTNPQLVRLLEDLASRVVAAEWPYPVTISAASLRFGGLYPPHFTHVEADTLDMRPMSTDGKPTWAKQDGTHAGNYDLERTKILIAALTSTGATVRFNGKGAGGQPLAGHDNHLHASWQHERVLKLGRLQLRSPRPARKGGSRRRKR